VIGSHIVLVNFSILNIIYRPIKIIHIRNISVHIKIRCVPPHQSVHHCIHHEQFEAIGGAGISVKLGEHACRWPLFAWWQNDKRKSPKHIWFFITYSLENNCWFLFYFLHSSIAHIIKVTHIFDMLEREFENTILYVQLYILFFLYNIVFKVWDSPLNSLKKISF
jgi:hypothetical protein